jgi:lipid II:glycine glycyltransferase (peptidoglycan interpeptide bridge formation enzyme)
VQPQAGVAVSLTVREAEASELADWDRHTVDPPGGNALQSRAWATYRSHFGWHPVFLVLSDGGRVLGLRRSGRLIRADRAYLSRGPIPGDASATARRLEACAAWFGERGVGILISDAEERAETGYGALIERAGFRPTEEIQPSRHRMAVDLSGVRDEDALLKSFNATTRNMVRAALKSDLDVVTHDVADAAVVGRLQLFHGLVEATGRRKQFAVASGPRFLDWSRQAMGAGIQIFIEARTPDGGIAAAATFYRHGNRWTYALAADDPQFRRTYPGAVRLVVWEAMRRALAEGRAEMDLGGVDVSGARRRPEPGEAEHGMLTFKESFGAQWVELAGAHEIRLPPADAGLPGLIGRLRRG